MKGQNGTACERSILHSLNTCRSAVESASVPGGAKEMLHHEPEVMALAEVAKNERTGDLSQTPIPQEAV